MWPAPNSIVLIGDNVSSYTSFKMHVGLYDGYEHVFIGEGYASVNGRMQLLNADVPARLYFNSSANKQYVFLKASMTMSTGVCQFSFYVSESATGGTVSDNEAVYPLGSIERIQSYTTGGSVFNVSQLPISVANMFIFGTCS